MAREGDRMCDWNGEEGKMFAKRVGEIVGTRTKRSRNLSNGCATEMAVYLPSVVKLGRQDGISGPANDTRRQE